MQESSTIDLINQISEFNDLSEYMQDPEIDKALEIIVKLMAKPDVPPSVALNLIVQLQAYAAKFGMLASWYTNVKKDDRAKKNVYYSAREQLDRLVDSLKYSVRHYG